MNFFENASRYKKDSFPKFLMVASIFIFSACGKDNVAPSQNTSAPASEPAAVGEVDGEPYTTHRGLHPWKHWSHPEFSRPKFNWQWEKVRKVRCTSKDSHGKSYQIIEDGYRGREFEGNLEKIEDAVMDRCYSNSHHDNGCHLHDCTSES